MRLAPGLQQRRRIHRRVALRCGKAGMAKQFLNGAQISPAAQQMRREGMAQRVRARVFRQTCQAAKIPQTFLRHGGIKPRVTAPYSRCFTARDCGLGRLWR